MLKHHSHIDEQKWQMTGHSAQSPSQNLDQPSPQLSPFYGYQCHLQLENPAVCLVQEGVDILNKPDSVLLELP